MKAYDFVLRYGIGDDTCQPFVGLNWLHGFSVAGMVEPDKVRSHQCFQVCGCDLFFCDLFDFYGICSVVGMAFVTLFQKNILKFIPSNHLVLFWVNEK